MPLDDLAGKEFGNTFAGTDNTKKEIIVSKDKPITIIQKYSENGLLAESILINSMPYFLVSINGKVTIQAKIELPTKTLKPLDESSYVNKPYSFGSIMEVENCIEKMKKANLDIIFEKLRCIWIKYIDADEFHISICAADTVFTYFQDRIGLTHYLFFVGNVGSGKSNNLSVFHLLSYRNMTSTDITSANIYQYLQGGDEGVGTVCEDEADDIDEDREKMRIYKNGYTTGYPVLRTDTSYGRKQLKFNTFCFKAFAAERTPDSIKAKGFNQRIIELPCVYGFPKFDITEVTNPSGEKKYEVLYAEILEMRNDLLIYRLLHYNDEIADVEINLENREKQLFKPVIRVFQNTDSLEILLPAISKYVNQRRQKNANTLTACLYKVIRDLITQEDSIELSSSMIWHTVTNPEILPGEPLPNNTLSYNSEEFGPISQKQITQECMDVFGARKAPRHGSSNKLIFDLEKLKRLGKIYELTLDVRVVNKNGIDGSDGMDIGIDKYVNKDERRKDE